MPYRPYRAVAQAMWRHRRIETPAGNLSFVRYPWLASKERLKATADWARRYSSREEFEIDMRSRWSHPRAGRGGARGGLGRLPR